MKKIFYLIILVCFSCIYTFASIDMKTPTSSVFTGYGASTELTISGGVITADRIYHTIDTESDAATDDLDTINGGSVGKILILTTENDARDVVIKHATGNLRLSQGNDFTMDTANATIKLLYNGSNWVELSRSANL